MKITLNSHFVNSLEVINDDLDDVAPENYNCLNWNKADLDGY